jgi:hypothetical protein
MKFPVVGTIKSFNDVQLALNRIREFFVSNTGVGTVNITQPSDSATLTIANNKALSVDESWTLGKFRTGLSGLTVSTTKTIELTINGVSIKLAVLD